MSLMFEDELASFWAEREEALRVRARISKSVPWRALMTEPPWRPVAPVMRIVLDILARDLVGCCEMWEGRQAIWNRLMCVRDM